MNINLIEFKPTKYNMKYMKGLFKLSGTILNDEVIDLYNELLFDEDLIVKYELNQRDIDLLNYFIAFKGNIVVIANNTNFVKANMALIEHKLRQNEFYKNILCHTSNYDFDDCGMTTKKLSCSDYIDDEVIGTYNISDHIMDPIVPMVQSPKMIIDMTYFISNPIMFDVRLSDLYYKRIIVNLTRANLQNIMAPDLHDLYSTVLPIKFDTRTQYYSSSHHIGSQIINEYNANPDPDTMLGMGIFVY